MSIHDEQLFIVARAKCTRKEVAMSGGTMDPHATALARLDDMIDAEVGRAGDAGHKVEAVVTDRRVDPIVTTQTITASACVEFRVADQVNRWWRPANTRELVWEDDE